MIDDFLAGKPDEARRLVRQVRLREYPVFFGALAATLTEVYEPLGLNDNLTIPFFASLAMQWGFARIQSCASEPPLHWILNGDMWTQLQRLPLA